MLRRVSIEKTSVTEATEQYGVSRPTFYQTKASFDKGGLAGLIPRRRGPHGPHKLQGAALEFVQQQLVAGQPVRAPELAKLVRPKFDLAIHPRTIERSVAGKKNTAMTNAEGNAVRTPSIAVTQYEILPTAALGNVVTARGPSRAYASSSYGHVGLGSGGDRHAYKYKRPARTQTVELEGAEGTQNPNRISLQPWRSQPLFPEQPHE